MEVDFKYSLGDILTHVGMSKRDKKDRLFSGEMQKFLVLARIAEECPGGIQKHYRVRIIADGIQGQGITKDLWNCHEEELAPL